MFDNSFYTKLETSNKSGISVAIKVILECRRVSWIVLKTNYIFSFEIIVPVAKSALYKHCSNETFTIRRKYIERFQHLNTLVLI